MTQIFLSPREILGSCCFSRKVPSPGQALALPRFSQSQFQILIFTIYQNPNISNFKLYSLCTLGQITLTFLSPYPPQQIRVTVGFNSRFWTEISKQAPGMLLPDFHPLISKSTTKTNYQSTRPCVSSEMLPWREEISGLGMSCSFLLFPLNVPPTDRDHIYTCSLQHIKIPCKPGAGTNHCHFRVSLFSKSKVRMLSLNISGERLRRGPW